MKKFFLLFLALSFAVPSGDGTNSKNSVAQTAQMRELRKKAWEAEKKLDKLEEEAESIVQKEKAATPVTRNVYEILARCFTLLFDIQRFSGLLALNQSDCDKNDFVKCSIVIKNFASYFKSVSSQLAKIKEEMAKLKKLKVKNQDELDGERKRYDGICKDMESKAGELAGTRPENIIQNDVIHHLAMKSESLDELDAELEAENAIGVLRNAKVSTDLVIAYPAVGKILTEFGDKAPTDEMIYYLSFETRSKAVAASPAKGLVVFAGKFLDYGNMLIISNGEYRVFLYGMDVIFPSTGDIIEIGDYVGRMKETNKPVIKMELKKSGEPLDPRQWMTETTSKETKRKENETRSI
jgi:septal ring factor EnvC (AmiA/AmiB activator)